MSDDDLAEENKLYDENPKEKGCGCWLIGCGSFILIGVALTIYGIYNAETIGRKIVAYGIETSAEAILVDFGFPTQERDEIMLPIKDFGRDIVRGKIDVSDALEIAENIAEGPAFAVLAAKAFEYKHVDKSALSKEDKKSAKLSISRFLQGVITDEVDETAIDDLTDIILEWDDDTRKIKETLTKDELKDALKIMKDQADNAKIENKLFKINLADEVRKAIKEGKRGNADTAGKDIPTQKEIDRLLAEALGSGEEEAKTAKKEAEEILKEVKEEDKK